MMNLKEPNGGKGVMREHGKFAFSAFKFPSFFKKNVASCCKYSTVLTLFVSFFSREVLKEDESGSLKASIEDILFKAKRKR